MQFSSKAKLFFNFFLHFWNVHHILDILKKKDEPHSCFISEVIDCKNRGYLNA